MERSLRRRVLLGFGAAGLIAATAGLYFATAQSFVVPEHPPDPNRAAIERVNAYEACANECQRALDAGMQECPGLRPAARGAAPADCVPAAFKAYGSCLATCPVKPATPLG